METSYISLIINVNTYSTNITSPELVEENILYNGSVCANNCTDLRTEMNYES